MKHNGLHIKKVSVLLNGLFVVLLILFSLTSVKSQNLYIIEKSLAETIPQALTDDQDRQILFPFDYNYIIDPYVLDFGKDGILETVIVAYSTSESCQVYLIRDEEIVSGWPVELAWEINDIEIVGEIGLNGGTDPAIVIRWDKAIDNTTVITSFFAIKADGTIDPSYGFQLNGTFIENTIFEDIDDNGEKEYILIRNDEYVFYLNQNGNNITNWPIHVNETITFNKPVAKDISGDNEADIIVISDKGLVFAWHQNGTIINDFPFRMPMNGYDPIGLGEQFREKPIIADLNEDGKEELAIASTLNYLYVVTLEPPNNQSWEIELPENSLYFDGTAHDINNDGYKEIVHILSGGLVALKLEEDLEQIFYYQGGGESFRSPAIADLDRDNKAEIAVSVYSQIYVVNDDGTLYKQHQKYFSLDEKTSPLIYDFDNDNEVEIIQLTFKGALYIFETNDYGFAPWIYKLGSTTNSVNKDSDEDGLWDFEEDIIGTNINNNDTDGDTIIDGLEINQYVMNPLTPDIGLDSDSDGISNILEVETYGSNPLNPDTDGDTISDGDEISVYFTNPNLQDSDNDSLPDNYEILYDVLDPNDPTDATEDPDEDNLINRDERSWGTNPENPDTDGDGLLDGDEAMRYFTDPNTPDADTDHDGDGLTTVEEVDIYLTDPTMPDTDGDGYDDGLEISKGTDPLDPESFPTKRASFTHLGIVFLSLVFILGIYKLLNRRRNMRSNT